MSAVLEAIKFVTVTPVAYVGKKAYQGTEWTWNAAVGKTKWLKKNKALDTAPTNHLPFAKTAKWYKQERIVNDKTYVRYVSPHNTSRTALMVGLLAGGSAAAIYFGAIKPNHNKDVQNEKNESYEDGREKGKADKEKEVNPQLDDLKKKSADQDKKIADQDKKIADLLKQFQSNTPAALRSGGSSTSASTSTPTSTTPTPTRTAAGSRAPASTARSATGSSASRTASSSARPAVSLPSARSRAT